MVTNRCIKNQRCLAVQVLYLAIDRLRQKPHLIWLFLKATGLAL
jgi:hypothetical protein